MKMMDVPLELLDLDPHQPRTSMDVDEIKRLALSLRDVGQLQPVVVYPEGNRYRIVDGARRFQASTLAKLKSLTAGVLDHPPDARTKLISQLAANCLRVDLTPLEKARALQRLKDADGLSNRELSQATRLSEGVISQSLSLLEAPTEVQASVERGEMAASTAYYVGRTNGEARKDLLKQARAGTLTRETAQAAATDRKDLPSKPKRIVCRMQTAVVTIASEATLTLADLDVLLKKLQRQARLGVAQGFDVKTFQSVLADQSRAAATKS